MSEQTIHYAASAVVATHPPEETERSSGGKPRIELRRILTEEAAEAFTNLLLSELPAHYDGVDETFPESILSNAVRDRDPYGYFTLGKDVYASYVDGQCAGFTVVTRKRGGSAKIGPTAVLPKFRRTGVASALRDAVERKLYDEFGIRKLYMTVSASNMPALLFNLDRGFAIEGILRGQYRRDQDEFVLGNFNFPAERRSQPPGATARDRWRAGSKSTAGLWTDSAADELEAFLAPRLADSFDQIDGEFYQAIIDACHERRQSYHQKGKRLFAARTNGKVSAVAVYVPKRGGGVKLSPCIAENEEAARKLVAACVALAESEGHRKVYVHVPDVMLDLVGLLVTLGFSIEAQLRQAYKPGSDMLVLGRHLS